MTTPQKAWLSVAMQTPHRDYVLGLVRMDLRKRQRAFDRLAAKPGQSVEDYQTFVSRQAEKLMFMKEVYELLHSAKLSGPNKRPSP